MKIDPELSGSEGISPVGRSPNLTSNMIDAIESVDRERTTCRLFNDYAPVITEIGRVGPS